MVNIYEYGFLGFHKNFTSVVLFYVKIGLLKIQTLGSNYLAQFLMCGNRAQLCFGDLTACSSALTNNGQKNYADTLQDVVCHITAQTPPCLVPLPPSLSRKGLGGHATEKQKKPLDA